MSGHGWCWQCGTPLAGRQVDFCSSRCSAAYYDSITADTEQDEDDELEEDRHYHNQGNLDEGDFEIDEDDIDRDPLPEGMIDYDEIDRQAYDAERNETPW